MKKKYVNMGRDMGTIHLVNGGGKFLKRGQSIELDESDVTRVDAKIVVRDVSTTNKSKKSTTDDNKAEQEE